MKVIFVFLLFGFIFLCGCSSPFSPVGTWKLYIKRNNKVEKMQTPETVIMIYHDGTFLCVAKENPHPEYNKGNWYQKGKKIVFKDKNGQYRMFINKDSLILEQQPFKPQGMELIYLRKHSDVVGCMMEGNFPNGSAGSATSFSEKACSYLESKSKVWPDGYSQVRPFDDAIKLARQVSLVGRNASTNQVKEILGVPNVVRQRAGKQRNDIRGLDFRYWLRKKDSRTVNVNDEDLTLRFDNLGVVQQMEFAKGTNVLIYVFPRNVVNVE